MATATIEVGRFYSLNVIEVVDGGVLLDARGRDLFLPSHLVTTAGSVGAPIEVFIYCDHEGAPQATTKAPAAVLGEFAYLKCVAVTPAGAFLAWGIPKDLYVPPHEQNPRMVEGRSYVVAVCLDHRGERLIGSAQLAQHFDYDIGDIEAGREVDLLVYGTTDVGVQVVVDRRHRGLVYHTEVFKNLRIGEELRGYVRQVREDNRLDVGLTRCGLDGIQDAQQVILAALKRAGGSLPLHDRSPPEEIERALGMSKKAFKRGAGGLYKAKRIVIDENGIRLVDEPR